MSGSLTFGFTLGERLGKIRKDHHLTKKAMAEKAGVSPSTWAGYENDMTVPSEATVVRLCGIFHVNEDWLWENEGEIYADGYRPGDPLGEPVDFQQVMKDRIEEMQMKLWFGDRPPEEMKEMKDTFEKWVQEQMKKQKK